uniref:ATPase subunit 8 n=1 Tax=Halocynthia papillosa TaxID=201963 RepID=A0A1L7PQ49_HALPP|nr:ATPase subunit 8 [Halocynthia papillosa]
MPQINGLCYLFFFLFFWIIYISFFGSGGDVLGSGIKD